MVLPVEENNYANNAHWIIQTMMRMIYNDDDDDDDVNDDDDDDGGGGGGGGSFDNKDDAEEDAHAHITCLIALDDVILWKSRLLNHFMLF